MRFGKHTWMRADDSCTFGGQLPMKRTVREIMKTRDITGLAEYIRGNLGLTVTDAHAHYIMDQAARVGGPQHDPWSESTWCMWVKGKATQPPPTADSPKCSSSETPRGM